MQERFRLVALFGEMLFGHDAHRRNVRQPAKSDQETSETKTFFQHSTIFSTQDSPSGGKINTEFGRREKSYNTISSIVKSPTDKSFNKKTSNFQPILPLLFFSKLQIVEYCSVSSLRRFKPWTSCVGSDRFST